MPTVPRLPLAKLAGLAEEAGITIDFVFVGTTRETSESLYGDIEHERFNWNVTLKRGRRRFHTPFSRGNPGVPTVQDVLDCVFSDLRSAEWESYEAWVENMDADPDELTPAEHRKFRKMYRICERYGDQMRNFLGDWYDAFYDVAALN